MISPEMMNNEIDSGRGISLSSLSMNIQAEANRGNEFNNTR